MRARAPLEKMQGAMNVRHLLPAALWLTACSAPPAPPTLKLGVIQSLTGSLAGKSAERLEGVTLAVEQINAAGGVLGRKLELVIQDDGTDAARARAAAEQLTADGEIPVIIGAAGSAATLAAAEVTVPKKVVLISGSATSPSLTSSQDDGYLFRTCPSDALQGRLIAQRALQQTVKGLPLRRAAIIHMPGAYGNGLADAFTAAFTAGGGTLTARKEYVNGQTAFGPMLGELYAANPAPQGVLLVAYAAEGSSVIKAYLAQYGGNETFWFFPDGLAEPTFVTAVGGANFTFKHEGTGGASPRGERYEAFKAAFRARFERDPLGTIFTGNYYDAVYLVALALQAAGKAEGPAVRDALAAISSGGEPFGPVEYNTAVGALAEGRDLDFEGASGALDFDEQGDVVAPYDLWRVESGAVHPFEFSVTP